MSKANRDLMLFSKEHGRYPYKYRLYFAERSSASTERPVIYRYCAGSKKMFDSLSLGGVYDVIYSGVYIKSFEPTATVNLSNDAYLALVDARDLMFMDTASAKRIGLMDENYDPADYYYDFDSYKALVEYEPTFGHKLVVWALKILSYLLCIVIPIGIYLLFIFSLSSNILTDTSIATTKVFALPVAAIGTLPFLVWAMTVIYFSSELLFLNMEYMRYYLLRSYALRWAGMRKSCFPEPFQKKRLIKTGIIAGSILAVCLIVVYAVL